MEEVSEEENVDADDESDHDSDGGLLEVVELRGGRFTLRWAKKVAIMK